MCSQPEDKLAFIVQTIEEMAELFEEDMDSVSWDDGRVEDFVNVLVQQGEGLQSCVSIDVNHLNPVLSFQKCLLIADLHCL